jgi:hypothetical protein
VRWTVYGLFVSTMLAAHPGAGQQATHLRAVDPNISPLIALGIERSATFRQLVHAIDSHDSYVYVKEGRCGAGAPACFAGVTAAGSTRFIWVKVDLRAADSEVISHIGHELRHALEVIEAPAVRDNSSAFFLYNRIGTHTVGSAIETNAAVAAGRRIRKELRDFERLAR